MMCLQLNSYNVDVAKVFGICSSIFLSCLDSEFQYQERNKGLSADSSISLSRAEIYARTALDDDKQVEVETSLKEVGVLAVKPLKNIPNKNYYIINKDNIDKIMNSENPEEFIVSAKQFLPKKRVEPISKRQSRILSLKKKVNVSDPVIQQYLCDWIDAVYSNPKGFLSPSGITIAQEELMKYAQTQDKQIAVLKIAIKGGLRDMTWAIDRHKAESGVGSRNFMEYNSDNVATKDDVSSSEVF